MHSSRSAPHSYLVAVTLALLLALLWVILRGYQGFAGDAQIYAFQALARIHPALSADLYLQNTSQDRYTVFSPVYAWFIGWFGLETAARLLTLVFTAWLIAAAWKLAEALTANGAANNAARAAAWLGAAFLVISAGDFGAAGVFRIADSFLTARLPAEALVVTALCCYATGRRGLAFCSVTAALFVHPLMALPGLLLLLCLWLSIPVSLMGAICGVFAALGISLAATALPVAAHVFAVMDADWLEVVQERSQFLFPQLWSVHDWDINLRPFLYLLFMAAAMNGERIRRICIAGLIVGGCGLSVSLIGCTIGPVAILVQGQAWRWGWIACFLSILLLPAVLLRISRDETCGPLCAVLLLGGWLISALGGSLCILLALGLWLVRNHVSKRAIPYFRWLAVMSAVGVLVWVFNNSLDRGSMTLSSMGHVPAVKLAASLLVVLCWRLQSARPWAPLMLSAGLLIASMFIVPMSFSHARALGSELDAAKFSDWSGEIPPTSTVLVAPAHDVGSFVWFTLKRPNYLALDQSAGVVFSRDTALEIRRRSLVLLPLTEQTWKILSHNRRHMAKFKETSPTRPLTAASLIEVCSDPKLGFVISPEDVGFGAMRHTQEGPWKDWNLYDCRRARQ